MEWKLQENVLESGDIEALVDFIRTAKRFTQFTKVKEFEEAWSRWQGVKYSVFVNSGSSANLVIMNTMKEVYGWHDGDEVIVAAVTWPTNVNPVIQCGLKPVFADVNLDDFSFDYEALESKITAKTRAIFVTHLLGFPADISRIKKIIGGRDIKILEDCCESHGAVTGGTKIGNLGLASSTSFYWGHHMTTVEGGMVCTNDFELYKSFLLKRSHGLARELPIECHGEYAVKYPDIDFTFLFLTDGFNLRNTEFNAVLGISQIKYLDRYIAIRNENYKKFLAIIKPYEKYLRLPNNPGISAFCLPFIFNDAELKKKFQILLRGAGVESRPFVSGNLLRQPYLASYGEARDFKNAEMLHVKAFYIGNNQFVNGERLEALGKLLADFFNGQKTSGSFPS